MVNITATVEKKGRKYWAITIEGREGRRYPGKLIINETSKDYTVGQSVTVECEDKSARTKYGVNIVYEPLTATTREVAIKKEKMAKAEKWLGYAESDVQKGFTSTNAVKKALVLCAEIEDAPEIDRRIKELKASVKKNSEAQARRAEEQKKERAEHEAQECEARANAQKEKEEKRVKRILLSDYERPEINRPWRMHGYADGKIIVVESFGKLWLLRSEDACVYGMLPDDTWVRYAYCRDATPEEAAALEEQERVKKEAKEAAIMAAKRVEEIKEKIHTEGERPEGKNVVAGEDLFDSMNIYGGGDVITITPNAIWYIRNNGTDGDDWSRNNVSTGGAGAIGWRMPYDAALVEELKKLSAIVIKKNNTSYNCNAE